MERTSIVSSSQSVVLICSIGCRQLNCLEKKLLRGASVLSWISTAVFQSTEHIQLAGPQAAQLIIFLGKISIGTPPRGTWLRTHPWQRKKITKKAQHLARIKPTSSWSWGMRSSAVALPIISLIEWESWSCFDYSDKNLAHFFPYRGVFSFSLVRRKKFSFLIQLVSLSKKSGWQMLSRLLLLSPRGSEKRPTCDTILVGWLINMFARRRSGYVKVCSLCLSFSCCLSLSNNRTNSKNKCTTHTNWPTNTCTYTHKHTHTNWPTNTYTHKLTHTSCAMEPPWMSEWMANNFRCKAWSNLHV